MQQAAHVRQIALPERQVQSILARNGLVGIRGGMLGQVLADGVARRDDHQRIGEDADHQQGAGQREQALDEEAGHGGQESTRTLVQSLSTGPPRLVPVALKPWIFGLHSNTPTTWCSGMNATSCRARRWTCTYSLVRAGPLGMVSPSRSSASTVRLA